ncbi:type II secretion system protein [Clostridium estertheticum]|uniref:type II secretion system protein n=1 Tax=Clostridium estertheticum TaxID=238834 RepID=UPI001C6E3315|nr:type II secretion system protein [Clostridium estertheticum]MBW9151882.1 type II secretion system GspH family protein [Clostridium estertheticum]WLC85373.1 type II secretion system GspH family protein [Clostridium estertheticum]
MKGKFMRRGFTLIEIILVLSIMGIIGGASVVSVRYYNTIKNKVDADYSCNAIVSFINNSKMYCRENSCSGSITFDVLRNEIKLHDGTTEINKLSLFNKIKLYEVIGRRSDNDIVSDDKGYSNDSCTIILKDNNLIEHRITMRVGTAYVKIIK